MCYVMCCASFICSVCYASFSISLYFAMIFFTNLMYCYALFTASFSAAMEHEEGATPELLDALVDKRHRSYMSADCGTSLGTFRARVPMSTMSIHRRWVPRYGLHLSHFYCFDNCLF